MLAKTLVSSSTVTPDAHEANTFYLTLTGDATIGAPINGADGEHITLQLAAGGHAVTWGAGWNFGTAGQPILSADKTDIISAVYRQTAADWYAGFIPGF